MANEKRKPCTRYGFEFTKDHLASSEAKNKQCSSCGMHGHFAQMCRSVKSGKPRGREPNTNRARMRRVNLIGVVINHS